MANIDSDNYEQDMDMALLEEERVLLLTRNEALYLSDNMTLLMEHTQEMGKVHVPARQLMPQASVPVPIDLIEKVGEAVLQSTDSENETNTAEIVVTVADLFLLRECCQSFLRVGKEAVGFNLLRKIYALILERSIQEQLEVTFIEDLTAGIDMSSLSPEGQINIKGAKDD
jgi:hypothetical protein